MTERNVPDGQHWYGAKPSNHPWCRSLIELKQFIDREFHANGEIVEGAIQYRPRNGGVPTIFLVKYEVHGGRYRMTGEVNIIEQRSII